jgi:ketosteroid isomerase-like protein
MKRRGSILCLLGSAFLWTLAAQAATASKAEQSVAALEQKWLQSQQTNNVELLAPLLADNFIETSSEGKTTYSKADSVTRAKAVKWSSVEYSDTKVTVFGETAIATGTFKGTGTDASGKKVVENVRYTDTWVKMPNGNWQCVASQDSEIKS